MKRFFLMMAMLISLAATNAANAQLNNVFSNPGTQQQQQPQQPNQTGSTDLNQILKATGLTYQTEGEATFLVTSEYEGVKLPVYVYMNKTRSIVWVKVNLDKLNGNPGDHADKLLKLMELSGSYSEAFYSFNPQSKFLELYSAIRVTDLRASDLATRIQVMTVQVIKQRDAWLTSEWTNARHVGSWSASMSNNGTMTIDLRADGSFELTNNAGGNVTSIRGSYRIDADKLQMQDTDGNQINGEIYFVDGNHFNLNVNNQNLSFERG